MLFFLICSAILIDAILYGAVIPVLPAFAKTNNIPVDTLCYLFALYPATMLIFSFPLGYMADKYGRRLLMILGMLTMAIATCIFAQAGTVSAFFISRSLQGLAATAIWAAGLAWICDIFPIEKRGEKIGIAVIFSGVGLFVGPVIGGALSQWFGQSLPFYFLGGIAFLLGAGFVFMTSQIVVAGKEKQEPIPWQDQRLLMACLAIILGITGLGLFEPLLPLYVMERFHTDKLTVGILFGTMSLAYVASQPFLGSLSDRYGRKFFMVLGFVITAVITPLITVVSSLKFIFLVGCLLGIGLGLLVTPAAALISDVFSKSKASYGVSTGFFNVSMSIGLVLGPLLGGLAQKHFGFNGVFILYALIMFVGGILAFKVQMPKNIR